MPRFPHSVPASLSRTLQLIPRVLVSYTRIFAIAGLVVAFALTSSATPCRLVTSTDDSSIVPGTLRYAIGQANAGRCNTIAFRLAYPATITLQQGSLEISRTATPIAILGPGATNLAINGYGNLLGPGFVIDAGVTASISGLTIENANAGEHPGGGILNNGGTLTVSSSVLSGNSGGGGAIANEGTLTVNNSVLSGNADVAATAGAILNDGTATVNNSTIADNRSIGGTAGIYNGGTLTVSGSTFSGNKSGFSAGAIANSGKLTVTNTTFSGNLTGSAGGGAIYNDAHTQTAALSFTTFSGNSSPAIFNYSGTLAAKASIVANSVSGSNCLVSGGTSVSDGYNLSDDTSCTFFTQTTDQNDVAPVGLDPNGLQDNGGPTRTIALEPGSPALDQIPEENCTDVAGIQVINDQRGMARPQPPGGMCDVGAFELADSVPFAAFTPTLFIGTGMRGPTEFNLSIAFTLDAMNSAIFPLTKPVTLTVGSYTVTVPATSFRLMSRGAVKGMYVFSGSIHGVRIRAELDPTGVNSYLFTAWVARVSPATSNPVPVTLSIGNDSSTAAVTANFR